MSRRRLALALAPLVVIGLLGPAQVPAAADAPVASLAPSADDGSSSGQSESQGNCVAYANGTSMGSYCATGGGGTLDTLRQRFGNMSFRPCRYSEPPEGISVPRNPDPDAGRWLMQRCIRHVDWDTYGGGNDKRLSLQLVYRKYSEDTSYDDPNRLEQFLWDYLEGEGQKFPRPYLRPKPNYVPLVGVPAFFQFDWLDFKTQQPFADPDGPYSIHTDHGGPFVQTENGDFIMRAIAEDVTIDPKQEDMEPADCGKGMTDYDESLPPVQEQQGENTCHVTFPRSSAASRDKSTHIIPDNLGDVYYLKVTVTWKVTYGHDEEHMQQLGDGFKMVSYQPLPVQEIQAPNLPPVMIF